MELTKALDALPTTCVMAIKDGKTVYEYGDPAEVSYLASAPRPVLSLLYGRELERSPSATPRAGHGRTRHRVPLHRVGRQRPRHDLRATDRLARVRRGRPGPRRAARLPGLRPRPPALARP